MSAKAVYLITRLFIMIVKVKTSRLGCYVAPERHFNNDILNIIFSRMTS